MVEGLSVRYLGVLDHDAVSIAIVVEQQIPVTSSGLGCKPTLQQSILKKRP